MTTFYSRSLPLSAHLRIAPFMTYLIFVRLTDCWLKVDLFHFDVHVCNKFKFSTKKTSFNKQVNNNNYYYYYYYNNNNYNNYNK